MSSLKNSSRDKPIIGIIANSTSPANRLDLIKELGLPKNGFFAPLKFSFKDQAGEIIALDIQPNEILSSQGMAKGKKALLNAVKYLAARGAQVICFTASTKRLPGRLGTEVKKLYPEITFSIGDSSTFISHRNILQYFVGDQIRVRRDEAIVCMGAGFMGRRTIDYLVNEGFNNITLLSEQGDNSFPSNIKVIDSLEKLPQEIQLFVSCAHKYQFKAAHFSNFLNPEAIIIDVAVPAGINQETYRCLPKNVSYFNSGDYYLSDIAYDFPPQILSFPEVGYWYGCFTEAVLLAQYRMAGLNLTKYDFFKVNDENCNFLDNCLKTENLTIPLVNFYQPETGIYIPYSEQNFKPDLKLLA